MARKDKDDTATLKSRHNDPVLHSTRKSNVLSAEDAGYRTEEFTCHDHDFTCRDDDFTRRDDDFSCRGDHFTCQTR